jgi:hypothetical protein
MEAVDKLTRVIEVPVCKPCLSESVPDHSALDMGVAKTVSPCVLVA